MGPSDPLFGDGLRGLAAFGAVLGLLLLAAWGLRRAGLVRPPGGAGRERLAVTATAALDGRNRLALVRCGAREHLLAVGPAGVALIATHPAPAGPAAGTA